MKFINKYKAILIRKSDAASKLSDMEPVKSMTELLKVIIIRSTSESRWFSKTIVELPPYTQTEIAVKFLIDYKHICQKIEDLFKSRLKTIVSIPGIPPKKTTLAKFFERAYKIKAMSVFPALAILVLQHPSLILT